MISNKTICSLLEQHVYGTLPFLSKHLEMYNAMNYLRTSLKTQSNQLLKQINNSVK